jgi:UDP-glucuronate 4-epimerase
MNSQRLFNNTTWLVTGVAGFIGMHTSLKLLARGDKVIGIDNLNDYYDVNLKQARLAVLQRYTNFSFHHLDIADHAAIKKVFFKLRPQRVIHLAAQAGVRYSIINPRAYIESNIQGFTNILEGCRCQDVQHLVYASSSSVYGGNRLIPFSEHHSVDHPVSLYAATKKTNELMAHTYSHLFRLPTTGLRFFTVYGPWGRPDMAMFLFTKAILANQPIEIYNYGNMKRDFTFIDDIVEATIRVADKPATPNLTFDHANPDPASSTAPYRVFNIGNNQPINLMDCIHALETALGITAKKNLLPMQAGDVIATAANIDELDAWVGFKPITSIQQGVERFVDWYRNYYKV